MSHLVLTGASGFIGRAVLVALRPTDWGRITVIGRRAPSPLPAGIQWRQVDLLAPGSGELAIQQLRPTHLAHLAWYVEHGKFWQAPENAAWQRASLELGGAFAATGGRRLVGLGSCVEYDVEAAGPFDERATPCRPATAYGQAKFAVAEAWTAMSKAGGPSVAWGRVFFPFGAYEGQRRLAPLVIRGLLSHQRVALTDGSQQRDFVPVDWLGRAVAAMIQSDAIGAFNLTSGEGRSIAAFVQMIGGRLGGQHLLGLGDLPRPASDPPMLCGRARRLQTDLGFAEAADLDDGIERAIAYWHKC